MKAVRFHQFGGPEVLVYENISAPEPAPGQALVRVRAVGFGHLDLDIRSGVSRVPISLPHILGREFAGEVAAVHDRSSPFKAGDRVWVINRLACHRCGFCLTSQDNLCEHGVSFGFHGGWGRCCFRCFTFLAW